MAFLTLQSGFYFADKLSDADLLDRTINAIAEVKGTGFRLAGSDKESSGVLKSGDAAALNEAGNMLLLKETKAHSFLANRSLRYNLYLINDYPGRSFLKLDPILSPLDTEKLDEVYSLHKKLVDGLIPSLDPDLVQINGLDDRDLDDIVHPTSWDYRSAPPFFAPYNYIREGIIPSDRVDRLKEIVSMRPLHDGYVVEVTESITHRPGTETTRALQQWYLPTTSIGYAHVGPSRK